MRNSRHIISIFYTTRTKHTYPCTTSSINILMIPKNTKSMRSQTTSRHMNN